MSIIKKFSIGTAQFGSVYGELKKKPLTTLEIEKILNYSQSLGIKNIDTAHDYGTSEKKLGYIGIENWKVSTKFSKIPFGTKDICNWIFKNFQLSLKRMRINEVETLFIHDHKILNNFKKLKMIFNCLDQLKLSGLVKNIGISVYDVSNLNNVIKDFDVNVIQAPTNFFDHRVFDKKFKSFIKKRKILLELRSIFLQGLLLMDKKYLPKKFSPYFKYFEKFDKFAKEKKITKISLALSVLKNQKFNKVVFGINDIDELKQIIQYMPKTKIGFKNFKIKNEKYLINPYLWKKK